MRGGRGPSGCGDPKRWEVEHGVSRDGERLRVIPEAPHVHLRTHAGEEQGGGGGLINDSSFIFSTSDSNGAGSITCIEFNRMYEQLTHLICELHWLLVISWFLGVIQGVD